MIDVITLLQELPQLFSNEFIINPLTYIILEVGIIDFIREAFEFSGTFDVLFF